MKKSNAFTLARLLYAPVFFLLYFIPIWTGKFAALSLIVAIPLLIFAEITDALDGHVARKYNEVSDFGKMFDPFADVMLHVSSFLCFMKSFNPETGFVLPIWIFVLIFYREFSQNFLRMVSAKKGVAIAARKGGKLKTIMYVVAEFYCVFLELLVRLNIVPECMGILKIVAIVLFIICVILSYVSFVDYLIHFGKVLKE